MSNQALAWQWPTDGSGSFCMLRLGMIARGPWVMPSVFRFGRAIDRSARQAIDQQSGLLKSERIILGWNHFGYLQYWRDIGSLLAWTRTEPHTQWWKEALERQRKRGDLVIYHETYLATEKGFEAIYLDLDRERPGASGFGELAAPKGRMATARGRLEGGAGPPDLTGQTHKPPPNRI